MRSVGTSDLEKPLVLGQFGWISEPGGVVRMTMYTADRQGYRVKHITRAMERESRQKEKGEISSKARF